MVCASLLLDSQLCVQWCRFKRLCQRTGWKNILVTLSLSHQLWIAWKFESAIANMVAPTAGRVSLKENITPSHKLYAMLSTFMTQPTASLQVEWLQAFRFKGLTYDIGCHFKIAAQGAVEGACLLHCIRLVDVSAGWKCILLYKSLNLLPQRLVPAPLQALHGKGSMYVDGKSPYGPSKKVSCLSTVDVQLCKLVRPPISINPSGTCLLLEF